jgi:AcrR family transcriptional regulator
MCPKVTVQHKSEIRERIVQAAIENFAKHGFDRTRMDDIANTSDLSKGTLYLYFNSKEDLFYAICERNVERLKEQLSTLFRKKEDVLSDAKVFYENFRKITHSSDVVFFEMIAESSRNKKLHESMYEMRVKTHQAVVESLRFQIKSGIFRKDIDVNALATGLIALYDGLTFSRLIGIDDAHNRKAWTEMIHAVLSTFS